MSTVKPHVSAQNYVDYLLSISLMNDYSHVKLGIG